MSDQEYPLTERLVLAAAQQLVRELVEKHSFHTNPWTLYNLPEQIEEETVDSDTGLVKRTYFVRFRPYNKLTEDVRVIVVMDGYALGNKACWFQAIAYAWHNSEIEKRIVYFRIVKFFKDDVGVPDVTWANEPARAIKFPSNLMPLMGVLIP